MSDAVILKNISAEFDGRPVLRDISLEIPAGVTCVWGPSGSGKTTLLRIAAGLQQPTGGAVSFPAGLRFSVVFQEDRLLWQLSALDNVALVCRRDEAERRLTQVGLGADMHKLPGELSGGMKRRAALARALGYGGDVLLLDEPFAGVDLQTASSVMSEIKSEYAGRTVLLVTHDRAFAERFADRIFTLPSPIDSD